MGIQKCGLNLNQANKELHPHGTLEFPCAAYQEEYGEDLGHAIPWHWHEEMELIYVQEGKLKVQLPGKICLLQKGDCMAINCNILHAAAAAPRCHLQSLVFHPRLVTGSDDSVFAKKYLFPLKTQGTFDGFLFDGRERGRKVGGDNTGEESRKRSLETGYFLAAFEALAEDAPGFEFAVRENLSRICYFLYRQFEKELAEGEGELNLDSLRIRKMMDYMHGHFSDSLTLGDVARAADIGERECLRCFQRTIQLSPMQYLLKYRIMRGADFLRENPGKTVSEIAALCGFDSPSNFAKMFRRFYNCAPREYRASKV